MIIQLFVNLQNISGVYLDQFGFQPLMETLAEILTVQAQKFHPNVCLKYQTSYVVLLRYESL